jgi:indolepyruvate ferredoxin oxidoreductase
MTGTQALVRVILDQMRADRAAGRDTGAMVSGYPGSPLGGFDQELARSRKHAEPLDVVHRPGQNEELGATAVWGSQLVPGLPNPRKAGVLGVWYGKAPGVDRAADAFRHGNFVGAHPEGGLIALCGDDPTCKSSTLPSATESALAALGMPVVHPGSVQELLDLGRHAIAASRASGLWVAVKAVSNVVDATGTVNVGHDRVIPVMPVVDYEGRPYRHAPNATLLTPWSLEMERTLVGPRLELARAYARENKLNQITADPRDAWLGIAASGTAYYDVREGLRKLGVTPEELGIRLLKVGMLWPQGRPAGAGPAGQTRHPGARQRHGDLPRRLQPPGRRHPPRSVVDIRSRSSPAPRRRPDPPGQPLGRQGAERARPAQTRPDDQYGLPPRHDSRRGERALDGQYVTRPRHPIPRSRPGPRGSWNARSSGA